MWIGRMTGRFWQRKIWVDRIRRSGSSEYERTRKCFFFLTSRIITSPFFQERLQVYIVVASVLGWSGGKMSEGAGAMISRSHIFPATSFRGLTLGRGWIFTSTTTNWGKHNLKVTGLAPVLETLDSVIPIQWISIKETNCVIYRIDSI